MDHLRLTANKDVTSYSFFSWLFFSSVDFRFRIEDLCRTPCNEARVATGHEAVVSEVLEVRFLKYRKCESSVFFGREFSILQKTIRIIANNKGD